MTIAIDCRLIGPTGIGVFIENTLENIVKDKTNEYVLLGNLQKLDKYSVFPHCRIISCDIGSFSLKELLLFPVSEVNRCDAFYTPNFNIPRGIKVPIFSSIHDILFFDTENFGTWFRRVVLKWYIKRALNISKTVFTVSEFSKQRIKAYFHTSTDIAVVPNGINKSLKNYVSKKSVTKNGIIFLGSIKRHKGLHILLSAYQKLRASVDDCPPLRIIGHVDFRTRDEEIISIINNNKDGVSFLGAVDNNTLYKIISESEVLVSPSLYEGFGIPPLEALYLGTPVIISDIPVYKEIYNTLPVTFFKTGDDNDLFEKLKEPHTLHKDLKEVIDQTYSYEVTAKIILSRVKRFVNL